MLNKASRKGKLAHDMDEPTADAAIEFLKRKHDKPFLLVASFLNPHDICMLASEDNAAVQGRVEEVRAGRRGRVAAAAGQLSP